MKVDQRLGQAALVGVKRNSAVDRGQARLGIDIDAVSVKATTSEQLGFTGRGEGIAAQAICLLVRA